MCLKDYSHCCMWQTDLEGQGPISKQGDQLGGVDEVARVELIRTEHILKVNSTVFAKVQYGECERKEGVKDDSKNFHLNKWK